MSNIKTLADDFRDKDTPVTDLLATINEAGLRLLDRGVTSPEDVGEVLGLGMWDVELLLNQHYGTVGEFGAKLSEIAK